MFVLLAIFCPLRSENNRTSSVLNLQSASKARNQTKIESKSPNPSNSKSKPVRLTLDKQQLISADLHNNHQEINRNQFLGYPNTNRSKTKFEKDRIHKIMYRGLGAWELTSLASAVASRLRARGKGWSPPAPAPSSPLAAAEATEGKVKKCSRKSSSESPGGGGYLAMAGDVGVGTGPTRQGPKLRAARDKRQQRPFAIAISEVIGSGSGSR
jgi:hypothetical protein